MGQDRPRHADLDAVVVGAGFAGLYALYRLRQQGLRVRVYEAGNNVGGTWYWNRYPGARCDIESLQYSYQFSPELEQEWEWSERYATQPEILGYIEHVVERFDLRQDIVFGTRVTEARYEAPARRWMIATQAGAWVSARYCIMAVGCLSAAHLPGFPGLETFHGCTYHTGAWPHEAVNFAGQRVAVIGTGSSGIQCIPIIAEQADHLTVFQRTPNYAVPAWNGALPAARVQAVKSDYRGLRARAKTRPTGYLFPANSRSAMADTPQQRAVVFEEFWRHGGLGFMAAYGDLFTNPDANGAAAEFVRAKIRAKIDDPAVAELLIPDTVIGSKRLCVESGYYETFNRPNVTLVDIRDTGIECVTPAGLRVAGQDYAFDAIVFATGFDAITGSLLRVDIRGGEGQALSDKWSTGPRTFLGLATAGFPNLFMINGPGSPSVLSNMVQSIEQHVDFIVTLIAHMAESGYQTVVADPAAEDAWAAHNQEAVERTLRATNDSWYVGANIPGRPRVFMPYAGGVPAYLQRCAQVVADNYAGFTFS
jgi:cation diffusion facilitator CzcD-associated flavoprotein CzcO